MLTSPTCQGFSFGPIQSLASFLPLDLGGWLAGIQSTQLWWNEAWEQACEGAEVL